MAASKWGCRREQEKEGRRFLTARSGLRQSLCDTARMTPARQPRQLRPLSRRSGRSSSPTATHRNLFPTSSGRVSTAIADTAEAAAALPPLGNPRNPLLPAAHAEERRPEGSGSPERERAQTRGAPDALPRRAQRPRSRTQHSPGLPVSQPLTAAPRTHAHTTHTHKVTNPHKAVGSPEAAPAASAAATEPRPVLLRLPIHRHSRERCVSFRGAGGEEGAAEEGPRNHRRRKVVPDPSG